jgi:hypothetical protein
MDTEELCEWLTAAGIPPPVGSTALHWNTDLSNIFDGLNLNSIFDEQWQAFAQGGGNMLSAYEVPGNPHFPEIFVDCKWLPIQTRILKQNINSKYHFINVKCHLNIASAFQPIDFFLYQSQNSLAPLTTLASSGYFPPSSQQNNAPLPVQVNNAAHCFMSQHQVFNKAEHWYQALTSPVFHDLLGNIDEVAFKAFHLVIGRLLQDFITITCILIYYNAVIQS